MPLSRRPGATERLRGGVVVFCDPHSYPRNVDRIVDVPGFIPAVGIHPKQVSTWTASEKESFQILMRSAKIKALGEVGLDYQAHHMEKQEEFLGTGHFLRGDQKRGLKGIPAERLLLATDGPYRSTVGKKNDNTPHHLGDVAVAVASVREEPVSEIIALANQNLCRLFRIPSA
ncbi:hydrolase TatD [Elysia marginata]|uniref:Hydrolase TatD n=1 Tax=Elysia marginata TaxID=1093978 RepID=A0AAV4ISR2_9GAST|nr:hydrolase TatD [Elysia marginata]